MNWEQDNWCVWKTWAIRNSSNFNCIASKYIQQSSIFTPILHLNYWLHYSLSTKSSTSIQYIQPRHYFTNAKCSSYLVTDFPGNPCHWQVPRASGWQWQKKHQLRNDNMFWYVSASKKNLTLGISCERSVLVLQRFMLTRCTRRMEPVMAFGFARTISLS